MDTKFLPVTQTREALNIKGNVSSEKIDLETHIGDIPSSREYISSETTNVAKSENVNVEAHTRREVTGNKGKAMTEDSVAETDLIQASNGRIKEMNGNTALETHSRGSRDVKKNVITTEAKDNKEKEISESRGQEAKSSSVQNTPEGSIQIWFKMPKVAASKSRIFVKPTTLLGRCLKKFCEKHSIEMQEVMMKVGGKRVSPKSSVGTLEEDTVIVEYKNPWLHL